MTDGAGSDGRIGPNAIIQLREVLVAWEGEARAARFFEEAGLSDWYATDGSAMVPETIPSALFETLFSRFPHDIAMAIAEEAGERTARYVMKHRIPRIVCWLLPKLPARKATGILLSSIGRHAWTFAGSGSCRILAPACGTEAWRIEIAGNPLMMPACAWHVAVFRTLLGTLIKGPTQVRHFDALVRADTVCCFDVQVGAVHAQPPTTSALQIDPAH